MLFQLEPNTPRFQVFRLLNAELLYFLEQTATANNFDRGLFSAGAIGEACWLNAKTREKFEKLSECLFIPDSRRREIFETMRDHQDLQAFFTNPNRELIGFLSESCRTALKELATHLYCATKDLAPIIAASGGGNIRSHFNAFRHQLINGNICKACGMEKLAAFRAEIPEENQWRADYDHQLCKSKYPIFAVHPDNLVPLCEVCNQDAKKAKDLFRHNDGASRLAFYPYTEDARELVEIVIENQRDPEPVIKVAWTTQDPTLVDKLSTWDDIYEIRSRVEGQLRSLEAIIEDEINPIDTVQLEARIRDKARLISDATLKRKEWAFWYQKLFAKLALVDISPFAAKWAFVHLQGVGKAPVS